MEKLFAASERGLQDVTAQELRDFGLIPPPRAAVFRGGGATTRSAASGEGGGVEFDGDRRALYKANLSLRTASRVLVRLGTFNAAAFSELRKKASRLPWTRCLAPGRAISLRVTCHKSRLYHTGAIAERIAGAIGDRIGEYPAVRGLDEAGGDEPPQLFVVRFVRDRCTVSADASGVLLHKRGYRQAVAKAPLRETLAAGSILASGWDGTSPLLDPFCGSGAIPIEAALMARGIDPGRARRFAFMDWPDFDEALWKSLLEESDRRGRPEAPTITASDRDAGAIRMARENAERAGVAGDIEFSCRAISAMEPAGEGTGWVVTNPPYGLRTGSQRDLRDLYARFGDVLRTNCPGWHVAVLCSDPRLVQNTGLKLKDRLTLVSGGLPVRMVGGVVKG